MPVALKATFAFLKIFLSALVLHGALCITTFYYITPTSALIYFPLCLVLAFLGRETAKKPKGNFISLLLSLSLSASLVLLGILLKHPIIFSVFAVIVFSWIVFYRYNKKPTKTDFAHKGFILLFIFMFIIASAFDISLLGTIATVDAFAFLVLSIFLNGSFVHEKFIEENKSVKNMPISQIRKTYTPLLAIFCVVCLVFMLFWQIVSPPVELLSEYGTKLLQMIGKFLPKPDMSPTSEPKSDPSHSPDQYATALRDFGVTAKQNVMLENVGTVLSVVALIAIFIILIVLIIRKFIKTMSGKMNFDSDEVEFLFSSDEISAINKVKEKIFTGGNINQKIRRIYKKSALKNAKNISKSDTPKKISEKAGISDNLTYLYEKARYSKNGCTKDELEMAKKEAKAKF